MTRELESHHKPGVSAFSVVRAGTDNVTTLKILFDVRFTKEAFSFAGRYIDNGERLDHSPFSVYAVNMLYGIFQLMVFYIYGSAVILVCLFIIWPGPFHS